MSWAARWPAVPTDADPFARFAGLLPRGTTLRRTVAAADALALARSNGWTIEELAAECGKNLAGAADRGAVVLTRLRQATRRPPPEHPDATDGHWVQPLPWCGYCDNPRTRWVETAGGLVRCPRCWTDPPGYRALAALCSTCGQPTRTRDMSGRPCCPRCLT